MECINNYFYFTSKSVQYSHENNNDKGMLLSYVEILHVCCTCSYEILKVAVIIKEDKKMDYSDFSRTTVLTPLPLVLFNNDRSFYTY